MLKCSQVSSGTKLDAEGKRGIRRRFEVPQRGAADASLSLTWHSIFDGQTAIGFSNNATSLSNMFTEL